MVVPATSRSTEYVSRPIKYSDNLYVWRSDDTYNYVYNWLMRLANFTFSDNDISVEYAPDPTRFIKLCYKYQLKLFRSDARSSMSDERRIIFQKGHTVVSHGTQDRRACAVKRLYVLDKKYRSDFFYAATKLYSCNHNIVTIYETKFDGNYSNIAMEPCTCNFVEFAENLQADYHLWKILLNDVVLGVVHLHNNRVIHGSICPSNVLVKEYRTGVAATTPVRYFFTSTFDGHMLPYITPLSGEMHNP